MTYARAGMTSVQFPAWVGFFINIMSRPVGMGALSLLVKWPKHETDHSLHLILWLRMCGALFLLPLYAFMVLHLFA